VKSNLITGHATRNGFRRKLSLIYLNSFNHAIIYKRIIYSSTILNISGKLFYQTIFTSFAKPVTLIISQNINQGLNPPI
jgi:hypothetical protein